ncbi:MAG: hypothetical protein AAFP17_00030 [Pseudomonadota bacterium]
MPLSEAIIDRLARYGLQIVSLGITGAAALGIYALVTEPSPDDVPTMMYAHVDSAGERGDWTEELRATAEAFKARPIFHASRKPWQPPEQAPAPAPAPVATPAPRLMGIVGAGDAFLALMIETEGKPARRVREGSRLGPWQILAVGPGHVDIASERGERMTLKLKRAK